MKIEVTATIDKMYLRGHGRKLVRVNLIYFCTLKEINALILRFLIRTYRHIFERNLCCAHIERHC